MNLWCDVHEENHRFTPSGVERIVYGLQATLTEVVTVSDLGDTDHLGKTCPEQILREAGDGEIFRDVVDSMRDSRISEDRRRKPQLRRRGGA